MIWSHARSNWSRLNNHWIGFRENRNRKPWFLPSNIGLSCKFSHHPILWNKTTFQKSPWLLAVIHDVDRLTDLNLHSSSGWWCNVPILKNDGVRQWVSDDIPSIPYMKWTIKFIFETINQNIYIYTLIYYKWLVNNGSTINIYKYLQLQKNHQGFSSHRQVWSTLARRDAELRT